MLSFKVSKPIEIETKTLYHVKKTNVRAIREALTHHSISKKKGCYVLAKRAAKGYRPVYIGMTKKQNFIKEIATPAKVKKINVSLNSTKRCTLICMLVYKSGKGAGASKKNILDMETWLIQVADQRYRYIMNDRKLPRPKWSIGGVVNHGKGNPGNGAILKGILGL